MDELVTTGDLEQSIDGDSNDVEAMIADLKGQIASGKIKTPEEMEQAIEKLADKYDLKLSDDDKQKLLGLMKKLQGLDLNWDSIKIRHLHGLPSCRISLRTRISDRR